MSEVTSVGDFWIDINHLLLAGAENGFTFKLVLELPHIKNIERSSSEFNI
jgi:hypothetical protein